MKAAALDQAFVLSSYGRNSTHFTEGKGARLYDENGKAYIDFASGIGVSSVGHGNPLLTEAICTRRQRR